MDLQPHTLPPTLTGRSVVAAIFADRPNAERAIDSLRAAGFTGDHIGVAMRDFSEDDAWVDAASNEETKNEAVDGAVGGAVGGGLLGGVAGFLVGLVVALAIPGVGPIVAGGTLAAALGAATGGVVGALNHLGLPDTVAEHFDTGFRAGGVLLTVNAEGRETEAYQLLVAAGGDPGPIQALSEANRAQAHLV